MRMLDLFSGIGGFAYAAREVFGTDLDMVGFCDIDEYCFKVLEKNFPGVPIFNDVQKLTGENLGRVDMICGGFPCQDISTAGKGLGIEKGERSGLWSEFHRLIGELRPRFTIIENVSALTSRGLNIVLRDLAEIGYDAEWQCIGANQVGARHKRDRIWVVAYPSSLRLQCKEENEELGRERPSEQGGRDRIQKREGGISKSRLGGVVNGIPNWIHEPRGIPRVDKKKPNRIDRMKALGNSIVPQIPVLIMKRIKELKEQG